MKKEPERRYFALLLTPPAGWLVLFFFIPLAIILLMSFMQRPAQGGPVSWQFDGSAYLRLLNPAFIPVFVRSLMMAGVTTLVCLVLGYPLAYYIAQRPPRLRQWLHFLVLLPLWTNSLLLTYSWLTLLRHQGLWDQFAQTLGLIHPVSIIYTPIAVIIGLVYWYLPFMVYPVYNSIEKMDWTLMEAAHDLGATRFQAFRKILLPLTMPGVVAGSLLVFISALGAFVIPSWLGGDKTLMLGNLIQQSFLQAPQDWPLGAALSISLLILISFGVWLYLRVSREIA